MAWQSSKKEGEESSLVDLACKFVDFLVREAKRCKLQGGDVIGVHTQQVLQLATQPKKYTNHLIHLTHVDVDATEA